MVDYLDVQESNSKITDENMKIEVDSVYDVSLGARNKQDQFKSMYVNIKEKQESKYGQGNGDYELKDQDNIYELVPNRIPVEKGLQTYFVRKTVDILVSFINKMYKNKPYQRFYVLETVARVPYFSYISAIHLMETFVG